MPEQKIRADDAVIEAIGPEAIIDESDFVTTMRRVENRLARDAGMMAN